MLFRGFAGQYAKQLGSFNKTVTHPCTFRLKMRFFGIVKKDDKPL